MMADTAARSFFRDLSSPAGIALLGTTAWRWH